MSDDYSGYSYAELKEQLARQELPALRESGLLDPDTIRLLESFCEHYEPHSEPHHETGEPAEHAEETERYVRIVRRNLGENLSKAVKNEEWGRVKHATGISEKNSVDAGQLEWVDFVQTLVRPDDRHHMLNLAITAPPPPEGPTGVGKSYTAYSIIETLQYISDIKYASNNDTDPFDTVTSWTELTTWLDNTDGQKLFLWDEAAQVLMYDDQVSGKELAKLIRLLRKYNCHLILIGHTGAGIPKDTRRMLSFIKKLDQSTGKYGVGIEEQKNGWYEISDERQTLENIPPTKIEYDDINDEGIFEFDVGETEDNGDSENSDTVEKELIRLAVEDYISSDDGYRKVADRHNVNKDTLRRRVEAQKEENGVNE
jgi:hypothetical protein